MKKRALSDVISTVLIILLVLIAIIILWFFIRPFVFSSSEQVESSGSCINVRVSPVTCTYTDSNLDGVNRYVRLNIRRDGGEGLSGIRVVFENQVESLVMNETEDLAYETNKDFGAGESKNFIFFTDEFKPDRVTVSAVVNNKQICRSLATPIDCQKYQAKIPCSDLFRDPLCEFISDRSFGDPAFSDGIDSDCYNNKYYTERNNSLYLDMNQDFSVDYRDGLDYYAFQQAFNLGSSNPSCSDPL